MRLTHLNNIATISCHRRWRYRSIVVSLFLSPSHLHHAIPRRHCWLRQPQSAAHHSYDHTTVTSSATILIVHHWQPLVAAHISSTTPSLHAPPMVVITYSDDGFVERGLLLGSDNTTINMRGDFLATQTVWFIYNISSIFDFHTSKSLPVPPPQQKVWFRTFTPFLILHFLIHFYIFATKTTPH